MLAAACTRASCCLCCSCSCRGSECSRQRVLPLGWLFKALLWLHAGQSGSIPDNDRTQTNDLCQRCAPPCRLTCFAPLVASTAVNTWTCNRCGFSWRAASRCAVLCALSLADASCLGRSASTTSTSRPYGNPTQQQQNKNVAQPCIRPQPNAQASCCASTLPINCSAAIRRVEMGWNLLSRRRPP